MEVKKSTLTFLDISPYVRYAHRVTAATAHNHQIPTRQIYDYEFLFVTSGVMRISSGNEAYVLEKNDIHIIPPMTWHSISIPDGEFCDYYSVHFDFVNLGSENDFSPEEIYIARCNRHIEVAPVDEKLTHRPCLCIFGEFELPKKMRINDPVEYIKTLKNMIEVQEKKEFAYQIDLKCGMLVLLKLILNDLRLRIIKSEDKRHEYVASIAKYMVEHYREDISFNALCHMYGYSYSSFRHLFKQRYGKSPNDFIIGLRIEKASELLYTGKYTISEVAYLVGYNDSAYFSRIFKKRKGCSPSAYMTPV